MKGMSELFFRPLVASTYVGVVIARKVIIDVGNLGCSVLLIRQAILEYDVKVIAKK